MPSTGLVSPSSFANVSPGDALWTMPSYYKCMLDIDQSSQYLWLTGFLFPSFPSASQIDGIGAIINRHATGPGKARDDTIRLIVGGILAGDSKAVATNWASSPGSRTYGGSADKWSLALTGADVQSFTDFGIAIRCYESTADDPVDAFINSVSLEITFTAPEKQFSREIIQYS
jgi:hypothetical protein